MIHPSRVETAHWLIGLGITGRHRGRPYRNKKPAWLYACPAGSSISMAILHQVGRRNHYNGS